MSAVAAGRAPSPVTWAAWTAAALPVVHGVGFALVDFEGYLRGTLELGAAPTAGLPADFTRAAAGFAAVALLGFLADVLFVVLAAVDHRILRQRGIERPFSWAWGVFGLLNSGALVYLIGRTVVGRARTGRSASAPLWLWVGLTVVSVAAAGLKVGAALTEVGPLIAQLVT